MNFFIHIGIHKTGSTALQHLLLENRLKLQEYGFFYPKIGLKDAGHHKIAWASKNKSTFSELSRLINSIKKEAIKLNCNNIILSSEEFEFIRDLNNLKAVMANDNCQIIIFLRRHDTLLESEYNQHVKMFRTKYSENIFKFNFDHDFTQRFNYKYLCNLWSHKFGQEAISVISYDLCAVEPDGIFKAFFNTINIPFNYNFLNPDTRHANVSLPNKATLYLARLNKLALTAEQHHLAISLLINEFREEPNCSLLSLGDRKKLWIRYKSTTEFVEKNYQLSCFLEPSQMEYPNPPLDFCIDFDKSIYTRITEKLLGDI